MTGRILQFSGRAEVQWDVAGSPTGRRVSFEIEALG